MTDVKFKFNPFELAGIDKSELKRDKSKLPEGEVIPDVDTTKTLSPDTVNGTDEKEK